VFLFNERANKVVGIPVAKLVPDEQNFRDDTPKQKCDGEERDAFDRIPAAVLTQRGEDPALFGPAAYNRDHTIKSK
jgi:hypothetical protein